MQFGGPNFSFTSTYEQLDESLENKNQFAFKVIDLETIENIRYCEIYLTEDSAKLGRIMKGKKQQRGRVFGKQIMIH